MMSGSEKVVRGKEARESSPAAEKAEEEAEEEVSNLSSRGVEVMDEGDKSDKSYRITNTSPRWEHTQKEILQCGNKRYLVAEETQKQSNKHIHFTRVQRQ